MQNYGLTILPDSKIRFRLGYDQNTMYGPGVSTTHEGTDQYLTQDYSTHNRNYRLGVDFRFLPRTTISYDQIWSNYKNDLGSTDTNLQFSPGCWFSARGPRCSLERQQPALQQYICARWQSSIPLATPFQAYLLHWRTRMDSPTEKVTVQSTYFKNVDFAGTFSYTGGDLTVDDYQQNFAGLTPKANLVELRGNRTDQRAPCRHFRRFWRHLAHQRSRQLGRFGALQQLERAGAVCSDGLLVLQPKPNCESQRLLAYRDASRRVRCSGQRRAQRNSRAHDEFGWRHCPESGQQLPEAAGSLQHHPDSRTD